MRAAEWKHMEPGAGERAGARGAACPGPGPPSQSPQSGASAASYQHPLRGNEQDRKCF